MCQPPHWSLSLYSSQIPLYRAPTWDKTKKKQTEWFICTVNTLDWTQCINELPHPTGSSFQVAQWPNKKTKTMDTLLKGHTMNKDVWFTWNIVVCVAKNVPLTYIHTLFCFACMHACKHTTLSLSHTELLCLTYLEYYYTWKCRAYSETTVLKKGSLFIKTKPAYFCSKNIKIVVYF